MSALVEAYARDVQLPKKRRRGRQEHRRCIYCTIVVGEAVLLKDGPAWEPFIETPEGPVCEMCAADPQIRVRVARGEMQAERKAIHSKQRRLVDGRSLSSEERAARNELIAELHAEGKCRAEIGERVGLTTCGVGVVLRAIRERRDAEIVRLAGLGWSWKRVSNKIGVSPSMVGKVVKRNRA